MARTPFASAKAKAKVKSKVKKAPSPRSYWPAKRFFKENRNFMMDLDWLDRHQYFNKLSVWMPAAAFCLQAKFSPCELLKGSWTGKSIRRKLAIPLPDKARKYRQALITEYFKFRGL